MNWKGLTLFVLPAWAVIYVCAWIKHRVIGGNPGWNDSPYQARQRAENNKNSN